jgi:hypothetical protein
MSSLPAPRSQTSGSRERKPLLPEQLLAVRCEASIADLIASHAVLAISVGDETDSDTRFYWLKADVDYRGHITGFGLQTFGTGLHYELPADLSSCSCPDHVYREERPGVCKHMLALRQALLAVAGGNAPTGPDEDVVHADTRWTLTEMPWPGHDLAEAS